MTRPSDEVVDEMVALVQRLVKWDGSFGLKSDLVVARAIVAKLPAPVDPDLLEARKIALSFALPGQSGVSTFAANRGDFDNSDELQAVHAAIKRGRKLAAQEARS